MEWRAQLRATRAWALGKKKHPGTAGVNSDLVFTFFGEEENLSCLPEM